MIEYGYGSLAQLARASRLHREGRGFESLATHHEIIFRIGLCLGLIIFSRACGNADDLGHSDRQHGRGEW